MPLFDDRSLFTCVCIFNCKTYATYIYVCAPSKHTLTFDAFTVHLMSFQPFLITAPYSTKIQDQYLNESV